MRYSHTFFTENRAKRFINELIEEGVGRIDLSTALDGFGQRQYTVIWYEED